MSKMIHSRIFLFNFHFSDMIFLYVAHGSTTKLQYSINTPINNEAMKRLSEKMFSIWKESPPPDPLDLGVIDNFPEQNCLIIMDNFMGVHILETNQPVILRKLVPAVITDEFASKWEWPFSKHQLTWWKERFNNTGDNILSECPVVKANKFLSVGHARGCFQLNYHKFASHSRSWHCEVRVDIFPPRFPPSVGMGGAYCDESCDSFYFISLWYFDTKVDSQLMPGLYIGDDEVVLPKQTPNIHVFIVSKTVWNDGLDFEEKHKIVNSWIRPQFDFLFRYDKTGKCHNIGYFLAMVSKTENKIFALQHLPITYFLRKTSTQALRYHTIVLSSIDLKNVSAVMKTDILHVTPVYYGAGRVLSTDVYLCNIFLSTGRHAFQEIMQDTSEPELIMVQIFLHVWDIIFGNNTVLTPHPSKCKHELAVSQLTEYSSRPLFLKVNYISIGRPLHTALQLPDFLNGFHFVTSQYKGVTLAFGALISIYD